MMKIGITGSGGLIGSALEAELSGLGINVIRFVRRAPRNAAEVEWYPNRGVLAVDDLRGLDAIVNLGGEPIIGRWTSTKREKILRSRVNGTTLLADRLTQVDHECALVSASAIGYYGSSFTEVFCEESPLGSGFLADVCAQWEAATSAAKGAGQRVVTPRIGIVLSAQGGALKQMLLPFKAGLGGVVASGEQWMSWISLRDTVRILMRCAKDTQLEGAVNCVGPSPVTNRTFTNILAKTLGRPAFVPVPAFGLRLAYGTMADETVLASQKVRPKVLTALGYKFSDPDLGKALASLVG